MTAENQNFTMYAGDSKVLQIQVLKEDGSPLDINGAAIEWTFRSALCSATALVTKTVGSGVTITTPASGIFQVALLPADTASIAGGDYFHAAVITETTTDVSTVTTGDIRLKCKQS